MFEANIVHKSWNGEMEIGTIPELMKMMWFNGNPQKYLF